jgi:xanthine dehydrogenase YagT iron-sulfur-binding subunit
MSEARKGSAHAENRSGVSRRGFLKGIALGAGAATLPAEGVIGKTLGAKSAASPPQDEALGPGPVPITLNVNDKKIQMQVEPRVTLLDALRNHTHLGSKAYVDLTGSKRVCDRSSCGACTVIVDGRTVYACSVLAIEAQGKEIQTIEGLAQEAEGELRLDPLQEAVVHCDGLMCGFCTPGFVLSAKALLDANPGASREEIQRSLDGNLCRCGTQNRMLEAVMLAASRKGRR